VTKESVAFVDIICVIFLCFFFLLLLFLLLCFVAPLEELVYILFIFFEIILIRILFLILGWG